MNGQCNSGYRKQDGVKVGKSRDRWTIWESGKKEKGRQKASPDRHMRRAAQLKGGCVCMVENLGRKKRSEKRKGLQSAEKGDSSERGLPQQQQQAAL